MCCTVVRTFSSRSAIGAEEALDVYLARGCNTLQVEVCLDGTGKELFDGLKRVCGHSKALVQSIEWPCLVTNAIAYGIAAMAHGGKDHLATAPRSLGVAHAVTATPRDFDNYDMPKDDKIRSWRASFVSFGPCRLPASWPRYP